MEKLKLLNREFSSFEGSLFRYSLAFSFLLAFFPVLIVVVMLFHNSILDIELLFEYLYRFVSEEAILRDFLTYIMEREYTNTLTLVISLIAALNLASRSIYSFLLISAKNESYNIPKIVIRIKSYILFIVLVISVGAISVVASFFPYSLPISAGGGLFVVFFILYRTLTFEKKPLQYGLLGAVFSTIAIALTSRLFIIVIGYLTSYSSVYGPMAGVIITLLLIYFIASIIYFGYCLNVVYGPSFKKREFKHDEMYTAIINGIAWLKHTIKGWIRK